MAISYLWEKCLLGITALGYAALAINAFINRQKRRQITKQSKTMSECERCSVELVRNIVPNAKVPDYRMRLKMPAIRVGFDNVGVKLKSTGRCILQGSVTGEFRPKRVAAIMGPSGAGKTTFMNALCGRAFYGTGGCLQRESMGKCNDGRFVASSIAEIKQLRGFVPQDDIVHEHLTVREQLYYSARLRNAEKTSRLDVQHSIVGNVERRGISGGQRKRVNIGALETERPGRAKDGVMAVGSASKVVLVVHQPRYSLFTLFDEVLLLGGGQTVYLGPSEGALPYFRNLGFKMPEHEQLGPSLCGLNPADWFMDVIAGKVKNADNPALTAGGLAEAWAESMANIMLTETDPGQEAVQGLNDRMQYAKALNAKLFSAGVEETDVLSEEQFRKLLENLEEKPCEEATALLMDIDKAGFDKETMHSSESSVTTKESYTNAIPDGKKLGRSGRFCLQFPILLHQTLGIMPHQGVDHSESTERNSIRWARNWRHKVISTGLTLERIEGGCHVAIGALTGVACLHIFGSDAW
eukprot:Skav213618  [mRNA]  locus=scaffold2986:416800:433672:+ [translate_table: standard]